MFDGQVPQFDAAQVVETTAERYKAHAAECPSCTLEEHSYYCQVGTHLADLLILSATLVAREQQQAEGPKQTEQGLRD